MTLPHTCCHTGALGIGLVLHATLTLGATLLIYGLHPQGIDYRIRSSYVTLSNTIVAAQHQSLANTSIHREEVPVACGGYHRSRVP